MRHLGTGLGLLLCSSAAAAGEPPLALELFITQGIAQPMAITHANDGSGRLFIAGRAGRIFVKPGDTSPVRVEPFLDLTALVSSAGEGGLLGLAFDPAYARNGRFYVGYTDLQSDSVVARYTVSQDDPDRADPASATVLLRIDQGSSLHKGGDLHFGPDGYLYLAFGDGAEGFGLDDCGRAQSLTPADVLLNDTDPDCTPDPGFDGNPAARALMGKLLRLDVARSTPAGVNELCGAAPDGSAPYAIPPGNPFVGSAGGVGRCDEILAWGLRNPFRFGIDRATGDVFIGDVGESSQEEVDHLAAGVGAVDFGWPHCEGTLGDCSGRQAPILIDDRSGGSCSIIGGRRYRGGLAPLQGAYLFSDYCTGALRLAREAGGSWTAVDTGVSGGFGQHACFGEDAAGEIYVCELGADKVRKLVPFDPARLFAHGFEY